MTSMLKMVINKYAYSYEPHNKSKFQKSDDQIKLVSEEGMAESRVKNSEDEEKFCFDKTGVITDVRNDHVTIDHDYFCETKYIIPTSLKKEDKVNYLVYKKHNFEIQKIYKSEKTSETEEMPKSNKERNSKQSDQVKEKKDINTKKVVDGKVIARKGRDIFVEHETFNKIRANLDDIKSEFVPFVGDFVELECLCETNENIINLQNEILEVKEIKAKLSDQRLGKVTEYNENFKFGIIDETIIFAKSVCSTGYIPRAGDKVYVHFIKSDQREGQSWRALLVKPIQYISRRYETSTHPLMPLMTEDELNELTRDKGNIEITDNIKVNLNEEPEKIVEITVKNNGNYKQTLLKCVFSCKKSESQLTLLNSSDNKPQKTQAEQCLRPSESMTYRFQCRPYIVGISKQLVIFTFRGFKIGRLIVITADKVQSKDPDLAESSNNCNYRSVKHCVYDDGMYIKGIKPYTPAKFIKQRPTVWNIPDILWTILEEKGQGNKRDSSVLMALLRKVPCLQQNLTEDNYKQRFEYLLYLDEIAQIFNMRQFDMTDAVMQQSGEFLTLNVPGLAEKRPSLIIGDKVLVSYKQDNTCEQKCYEGFIHRIKNTDVFLKFNSSFHEDYFGEHCQIQFKGSKTVLSRCHTAINMAEERLGPDVLFPTRVFEKEPQFNFIEAEDDDIEISEDGFSNVDNDEDRKYKKIQKIHNDSFLADEERSKAIRNILINKKIRWFNKKLNNYQKEAVKNILKGVARPLPYVIFGPPGIGKTITVCEAILQILSTMNDSHILVCTPSNSSANLIAERLLESKKFRPGDLVRLIANHYLESDLISDNLIPYCATADIAEEGTRTDVNLRDVRGYKKNVTWRVLRETRIIVGTCTAVGILHNMGCTAGHFTHVVIDEAGRASEPETMIPLVLSDKSTQIILAGDPKQLGPLIQSPYVRYYNLNDSYLLRLLQRFPYKMDTEGFKTGYDPRLITKLLMNYRSLPDLLELANKLYYDNKLEPQTHQIDSEEADLVRHLEDMLPQRLGDPLPIVFHAVDGNNMQDSDSPSWYNIAEVNQVCFYLGKLYDHGLSRTDIGIITPYSEQVYKIKNKIAESNMEIPKVGSVEEFQGQERLVIILSIVRTAEDKVKNDGGNAFEFHTPERVNVAITRARSLLIIIGNPNLLLKNHTWRSEWRSVLEHCIEKNSYVIGR